MPQPTSIPRFRPVIRVFVSSTFSDLKHERNALQVQVFPKLEQLCAQNGFQFQAIDLRWGVSSEAGLDHRTMRICFDELRRAQEISPRPNFLILLGNRYGWRPLPEEISVAEFQALEHAAAQVVTTKDQPATSVLQAWYRRDENAVPPVYLLQSRRQQLPDAKDYTQDAPWSEVQAVLWEIINRAMPPEQLRGRFDEAALPDGSPPAIVRFQASATEQEIWHGSLRVPDAQEHVLAFFRQIENVGEFSEPTQIKDFVDVVPFGVPPLGGLGLGVPRSRGSEPPEGGTPNAELQTTGSWVVDETLRDEQERLKAALRTRLGGANVFETHSARLVPARDSQGRPTADVTTDHLAQLCSDVESRLTQIIQGQIEEYWNKTAQASTERAARELRIEQDEHERFGCERGAEDSFVDRQTELQAILDYVRNDSPWPLVVHGASGCGKTALLARAVGEMQKEEGRMQKSGQTSQDSQPSTINHQPICRFIGVTPRSSDVRSLLGSLCQELRLRHPREGELPADTKALREELHEQFRAVTPEQPLILFLDALDQLSDADGGRLLNWIPAGPLPANMKLVVSCLSDRAEGDPAGQPCAELSRRQLPAENFINLDVLSEDEARTLLFDRWLHQAGRTVSRDQRERIEQRLTSAVCRQPIYLKLLFEEARLWRSYDAAPGLGEGVSALLGQLIERLGQPANHGPLLVERVLGYLAASRHGLAENEILEVLFADPEYKAALDQATEQTRHELPASATRIPIAIWSRLRFDLAPYLTERAAVGANVLTFYHRQVAEWVQEHFAKASDQSWQPHQRLAGYFVGCAEGTDPGKRWETLAVRGFAECVFHLVKAGQHDQAASLLSGFPFLLHKLRVGLLEGVFEDYDLLLRKASAGATKQLEICADFFREKVHILRRGNEEWPAHKIFLQLAIEHADDSPLTVGAERWLAEDRCNWLWLRRIPRLPHLEKNPCLSVLEGHSRGVSGALALPEGRILSWGGEDTLRLWDAKSGKSQAVLEGHSNLVTGALALPDGRIVSWSWDKTLRLWDPQSGKCLAILEGHSHLVRGALALPDDRILSWSEGFYSDDNTLRLWDAQSSKCLAVLEGHSDKVNGALALPDGRVLSWSGQGQGREDNTLRIWDAQSGQCLAVLKGHSDHVHGALALPSGRILSWSDDKTLRLWDTRSAKCIAVFEGHSGKIKSALAFPDGRILSWAGAYLSRDKPKASDDSDVVVTMTEGGAYELEDKTLRLWDTKSGQCVTVLEGHSGRVIGALALPDGRILSWSSDDTLRLWDAQTGRCVSVLEGHSSWAGVRGALALPDGRILSWASGGEGGLTRFFSNDNTLRLWDTQSGQCSAVLEGHFEAVSGALALPGGRLLTWSYDKTLRLWDTQNGQRQAVVAAHSRRVTGAVPFPDGRILSWSDDHALRLWDAQTGECLTRFEEHSASVLGACVLPDGRILSWSFDNTLRLWDAPSAKCVAVLEGHFGQIKGAVALPDGRILSWSDDGTMRLWDAQGAKCLDTVPMNQAARRHLDLVDPGAKAETFGTSCLDYFLAAEVEEVAAQSQSVSHPTKDLCLHEEGTWSPATTLASRMVHLRHKICPVILAAWEADSDPNARCLLPDGTAVVTQANGRVCILKLYYGNRRVFLPEAEGLLGLQTKIAGSKAVSRLPDRDNSASPVISYEQILRDGIEYSRREKGSEHQETLAYLLALAAHLKKQGKRKEAGALMKEHYSASTAGFDKHFVGLLLVLTLATSAALVFGVSLIILDTRYTGIHSTEAFASGAILGLLVLCGAGLRFSYPALEGVKEKSLGWMVATGVPIVVAAFSGLALVGQSLGTHFLSLRTASRSELLAKGLITFLSVTWLSLVVVGAKLPQFAEIKQQTSRVREISTLLFAITLLLPAQVFPAIVSVLLAAVGIGVCCLWFLRKRVVMAIIKRFGAVADSRKP